MSRVLLISIFAFLIFAGIGTADSGYSESVKKSNTQQVGGLNFDVDEGVQIEKGSGGSVYIKSNREFMQSKFESIESRLTDLEAKVAALEAAQKKAVSDKGPESDQGAGGQHKVLVS